MCRCKHVCVAAIKSITQRAAWEIFGPFSTFFFNHFLITRNLLFWVFQCTDDLKFENLCGNRTETKCFFYWLSCFARFPKYKNLHFILIWNGEKLRIFASEKPNSSQSFTFWYLFDKWVGEQSRWVILSALYGKSVWGQNVWGQWEMKNISKEAKLKTRHANLEPDRNNKLEIWRLQARMCILNCSMIVHLLLNFNILTWGRICLSDCHVCLPFQHLLTEVKTFRYLPAACNFFLI